MKRAFYDHEPATMEKAGNSSIIYRWDIQEEPAGQAGTMEDGGGEPAADAGIKHYSCMEVVVWATVTADKITEAVIGKMWDSNYEQKLINEYNAAALGVYGGSKTSDEAKAKIASYKEFLAARAALKAKIDADCAELGITE